MAMLARQKAENAEEARKIQTDPLMLMGLGIGAVVVIWLIFSVVKKVAGIAIVIALAVGAWMIWSNPELLASIMAYFGQVRA